MPTYWKIPLVSCLGVLFAAGTCFAQQHAGADRPNFACVGAAARSLGVSGRDAVRDRLVRDLCTLYRSATAPMERPKSNTRGLVALASANLAHKGMSRYFITDLGTLGGSQSLAYNLNILGEVVGSSSLPGDTSVHTFLYKNGQMIDLDPLGISALVGNGINDSGQIASGELTGNLFFPVIYDSHSGNTVSLGSFGGVLNGWFTGTATSINNRGNAVGFSYLDNINRHAFFHGDGLMLDLGSFGGYSQANAINDLDVIVGIASDVPNGRMHAFIYQDGVMKDIDPSGDFVNGQSDARDVNALSQVVGDFLTPDQTATHGFLYDHGLFTDIGLNGSPNMVPLGINDQGQVVGIVDLPYQAVCPNPDPEVHEPVPCIKYAQRAFLYQNGSLADFNSLIPQNSSWELTWALDINNRGQIVGYGLVQDNFRAFLLTPATTEQCQNDGWQKLNFGNQGQCIQFVNTGK